MTETIYTRDLSSGRVHKRILIEGKAASLEADNLDDAGAYEVITTLDGVEPADLCQRCFPPEDAA
jgi:hypothetical protein